MSYTAPDGIQYGLLEHKKRLLPPAGWEIANKICKELHESNNLMKLTRRARRRENRRIKQWNTVFSKICEKFISEILNNGLQFTDVKAANILHHHDEEWRRFVRFEIKTKYGDYKYFRDQDKREIILNKLKEFANKFSTQSIQQNLKPEEPQALAKLVKFQDGDVTINEAITMLKKIGVKTQAKTVRGVQKVLDKFQKELNKVNI